MNTRGRNSQHNDYAEPIGNVSGYQVQQEIDRYVQSETMDSYDFERAIELRLELNLGRATS